uniref:Envelope glycoprotein n=1 Tax=Strigops habroptila TaxID=2489341 RepID=A0A672UGJ4_STRHB
MTGRTWGVRYWEPGKDRGGLIWIRKDVVREAAAIGPNVVLTNQLNITIKNESSKLENVPTTSIKDDSLWKLMQTSYRVLNISNPNLTESCWLCYGIEPPFYEAIGDTRKPKRSNMTSPAECNWGQETVGVTLTQVSGSGRCIGKVPEELTYLCNYTLTANKSKQPAKWLIPAVNARWICKDTGVTPCVSLDIFRYDTHFCIQVLIVPKILYHPESFMYENQINQEHHLSKREPVTALTLAAIMILGGAGVGTGITSLIKQSQDFTALRIAVDEDLVRIEKSISALEKSVRSLSEVVLQNRRGLDLLLLQQGGLCVALKEECCVYADHKG